MKATETKGEEEVMAKVAEVGSKAVEGLVTGQKWVASREMAADGAKGVAVVVGAAPPKARW